MENNVITVLQNECLKILSDNPNPKNIPVTLLEGLHSLIETTKETQMLSVLYADVTKAFPWWIKNIAVMIKKAEDNKAKFPDDAHYDAIIKLVSASVQGENNDNVKHFIPKRKDI